MVERWSVFPSALARASLVLWRMEPPPEKSMGLPAPPPRAGEDPLHLAENDWRIFPYAVGPSVFRWNGEDNHSLTFAPSHAVRISRVHCFRTGSPAFLTRPSSLL